MGHTRMVAIVTTTWVAEKQQNFILAQFWRPEVRNQVVSMLPLKALGQNFFLVSFELLWLPAILGL